MNRKIFIILIIALVLIIIAGGIGFWFYYQKVKNVQVAGYKALDQAGKVTEDLSKQASQGVLPSINPGSNPMEKAPDVNPVSNANPFTNIKINPFK